MKIRYILGSVGIMLLAGCASNSIGYVENQSLCAKTQNALMRLESNPAGSLELTQSQYDELIKNAPNCKDMIDRSREDYIKGNHLQSESISMVRDGRDINRYGDSVLIAPILK